LAQLSERLMLLLLLLLLLRGASRCEGARRVSGPGDELSQAIRTASVCRYSKKTKKSPSGEKCFPSWLRTFDAWVSLVLEAVSCLPQKIMTGREKKIGMPPSGEAMLRICDGRWHSALKISSSAESAKHEIDECRLLIH
jgi:hypothetical protein